MKPSNYVKNLFASFLILFCTNLHAQPRIQSIADGVNQIGNSMPLVEAYLTNLDFHLVTKYKNFYTYRKESLIGTFEYDVSFRDNKANVVSWLEHIVHLNSIKSELFQMGFENVPEDSYSNIIGFKSVERNLTVTIVIRRETNDLNISVGTLNPKMPYKETSASAVSKVPIDEPASNPDVKSIIETNDNTIFTTVDRSPGFPGGEIALEKFLKEKIRYPKTAKDNRIQCKVYVKFIIDADGYVTNIEVLHDPGYGLGEEARRVVALSPKWTPATQNGKNVRCNYTIPIDFNLSTN